MTSSDSFDTDIGAPSERRSALNRIFVTPLEKFVPKPLRVSMMAVIAVIPVVSHFALNRHRDQSDYDLGFSGYGYAVKQAVQKDEMFDQITVTTRPRPSFWSQQSPYLAVTGAVTSSADYASMLMILNDPHRYGMLHEGEALDLLRQITHRADYRVTIDVTIQKAGERKCETIAIPAVKHDAAGS